MKITFVQNDKEKAESDRVIRAGLSLKKAKVGTWILPPNLSKDGKFVVVDSPTGEGRVRRVVRHDRRRTHVRARHQVRRSAARSHLRVGPCRRAQGMGELRMTLREVLNLADHEVWLRVRPHKHALVAGESDPEDIVVWSADWIMQSFLPPEIGPELEKYLDWDADDLSIEFHPVGREKPTPMLVINAYEGKQN